MPESEPNPQRSREALSLQVEIIANHSAITPEDKSNVIDGLVSNRTISIEKAEELRKKIPQLVGTH